MRCRTTNLAGPTLPTCSYLLVLTFNFAVPLYPIQTVTAFNSRSFHFLISGCTTVAVSWKTTQTLKASLNFRKATNPGRKITKNIELLLSIVNQKWREEYTILCMYIACYRKKSRSGPTTQPNILTLKLLDNDQRLLHSPFSWQSLPPFFSSVLIHWSHTLSPIYI